MNSIQNWQNKADQDMRAAELCFEQALYDVCVSRCYYAMFHIAIAALIRHSIPPRRDQWGHDYVQSQVAEQLIKRRKVLPATLAGELLDAMNARHEADYSAIPSSRKMAERRLRKARGFVNAIEEVIK